MSEQTLYTHKKHAHIPRNVNHLHTAEQQEAGFHQRLAVLLTKSVSSMWMAYVFTLLALIGLFGLLGWLNPFTFLLTTWLSQQFLQLVFLPILSVGQSVLGRKQELQSEEQYQYTLKSYHDVEQIIAHLAAQDTAIIHQATMLERQQEELAHALEKLLYRFDKLDEAALASSQAGLLIMETLEKKATARRKAAVKEI